MHTTCRSLPVCAPMIIAAPDLAFYECLCERLLHPPSTMTAIAGTPSWNDPLSMAFLFSSPAASFMLSSSDSRHDRPRAFSVATKDFLVITGTPSTTSSQRVVCDLHWSTSAPRRLPGCTPTADPPPPKAGHLGRGGECNLHATAATGGAEDRCQTLLIALTGQGDGAVLTRTRVGGDLRHKLLQLVHVHYPTSTYSTTTLRTLSTFKWLFLHCVLSLTCMGTPTCMGTVLIVLAPHCLRVCVNV